MRYDLSLTFATLVAVSLTFGATAGVAQGASTQRTSVETPIARTSAARSITPPPVVATPAESVGSIPNTTIVRSDRARAYGIVTDPSGAPIADAQLELATGAPFGTIYLRTDAAGRFLTDSLQNGETYSVAVARLGYRAVALKPFTARADSAQAFRVVLQHRSVTVVKALPPAEPTFSVVRLAHEH